MKVLVLSDIHGNIDALQAIEADVLHGAHGFDEIWVLGDLVDYGAAPADVIAWVRTHATRVVRGNHDHALGTGEDCGSIPPFRDIAVATREHFRSRLASADRAYLAGLPLQAAAATAGQAAFLVHAHPSDPLFGWVPTDASDEAWRNALAPAGRAAFVFVGHTHDQFTRRVDATTLVNPGSVGLPHNGHPLAHFAIVEDGRIELRRIAYDTERAAGRIAALPLAEDQRYRLMELIRTARLP